MCAVVEKAGKAKEAKRAAIAKDKEEAKARARWLASLNNAPDDAIMDAKPAVARVLIDKNNGCYRCSFPRQRIRSFSWTMRGHVSAARLALQQMWDWEFHSSGKSPPAHLDLERAEP